MDAVYRQIKGVERSIVGYAGGNAEDANYHAVATGRTNHAESVQVTFDEAEISSEVVLDIFFTLHDPTSLNRQGADTGPQYRSAMFYTNDAQEALFESARDEFQKLLDRQIVTETTRLDEFYPAEAEQQEYYANNPSNPYCSIVIDPKLNKVRGNFAQYLINNNGG